ncbi:MAG: carbohydrate kinase family protein, partial [Candidatus Humimicrobiaceae bacterium]
MKNSKNFDAVGFGITTLDYICIVDKLASYQKNSEIKDVKFFGGGCVSTALVALNRLGGSSSLVTLLGDDWVGKEVLKGLKEEKIDCSGVEFRNDQLTTFSFIQVSGIQGKRAISYYPGSGEKLKFNEKAQEIIKKSKMLLLDGLLLYEDLEAAKFARKNNVKVMLDCNILNNGTRQLLPYIDYLITSESFLYDYSKIGDVTNALKKLNDDYKPEVLVTTLGRKGSVALINDEIKQVKIFDVRVKDTTGCGDVYHGAFLLGLLRKWDLIDIMTFATAVSSIKSMYYGGRQGIPDFEKTIGFLKDFGINTD